MSHHPSPSLAQAVRAMVIPAFSPNPRTFPLFLSLPKELQLQIWQLVCCREDGNHMFLNRDFLSCLIDDSGHVYPWGPDGTYKRDASFLPLLLVMAGQLQNRLRLLWVCRFSRQIALEAWKRDIMGITDLGGNLLLSEVVNDYIERKHSAAKNLIIKELNALLERRVDAQTEATKENRQLRPATFHFSPTQLPIR